MPFKSKPKNLVTKKMARVERHFLTTLLLADGALVLMRLWWPLQLPGKSGWPEAVLLLLAVAGTIAALARHLPLQNVLSAAVIIALAAGAATWLDLKTGIPFGQFTVGDNAGPKLFNSVPWAVPVIWVRGDSEFARRGAAHSAAVAQAARLRFLAHRCHGGIDGVV